MSQPSQGQKPVFAMAPDEEVLMLFCLIWPVLAQGRLLSFFISSFSSPSALPQAMVQQDTEAHVSRLLLSDLPLRTKLSRPVDCRGASAAGVQGLTGKVPDPSSAGVHINTGRLAFARGGASDG